MIPFIDLGREYTSMKDELNAAVSHVMRSGWFVLGEEVCQFEREFGEYCGAEHVVGVGSGTAALALALLACGLNRDDEVITVPNVCAPTVSAIAFAGLRPVLVDVDPRTYTLDPESLRRYLRTNRTAHTKAIVPVHLYGQPADMDAICGIADEYGLVVVEDACQGHGAMYRGRKTGTLGKAGCFSFYPTKNLGACGDGGAVVTNDSEVAERVRMMRNYGESEKYYNAVAGFNSRLDEMQAAILRVKLRHLDERNDLRRRYGEGYNELLADCDVVTPFVRDGDEHAYHLYVVTCGSRDELRQWLSQREISTSIHYPRAIHCQPAFEHLGYREGDFPNSETLVKSALSLPCYPELSEAEFDLICRTVAEFEPVGIPARCSIGQ